MQKVFIELVLDEKAQGKTFLMSSHSFPEIERTCDRAAIIKDGKIITIKDIHELQSMQRKLFEVIFEHAGEAALFAQSGLPVELCDGNRVLVAVQGDYDRFVAETAKYKVRSIDIFSQNLEDVFMNYYDRKGTMK